MMDRSFKESKMNSVNGTGGDIDASVALGRGVTEVSSSVIK